MKLCNQLPIWDIFLTSLAAEGVGAQSRWSIYIFIEVQQHTTGGQGSGQRFFSHKLSMSLLSYVSNCHMLSFGSPVWLMKVLDLPHPHINSKPTVQSPTPMTLWTTLKRLRMFGMKDCLVLLVHRRLWWYCCTWASCLAGRRSPMYLLCAWYLYRI